VSEDDAAVDGSFAVLYGELHRLAHGQLWRAGGAATLNTTAVVHEAYLKLSAAEPRWNDRSHFLATAARVMRQVIIDYARAQATGKRGGELARVTLPEDVAAATHSLDELLAVDAGMRLLEETDARLARLVELRFFAGLTNAEIADVLALSERSVERDWRRARAFLVANLDPGGSA
jgi:RNA polymerase sigma factor (TIGR02999 family)